ncbi:MAG: hypothetical protein GY928_02065 [Colwellia sp.]|nr:hypothetical protein [Colwellia sp.]
MGDNHFRYTTAIKKIRALTKPKKVIQGSTSAGKTHGIIPILADRAIKTPKIKITVVAETIPAVKDGCVDIFKSVMQDTNRWIEDHWIGSPMEYTFSNGSRIQFKSFDTVGKAKASGKRDILFINEANHISYAIADTLMIRSRETYIDFNADTSFWAHDEVLKEPNSEFLSLTYLDNEALPVEILDELLIKRDKAFIDPEIPREKLFDESNIKSAHWANWWRVYGLGEIGTYTERQIYPFSVVKEIPPDAIQIASGMDFGKSPDPTVLINCYIKGINLYIDEVFIENNLMNEKIQGAERDSIVDRMNDIGFDKSQLIIGDSAGATELNDLKKHGYRCRGVKKTKVLLGMKRLGSYDIKVTARSVTTVKAFSNWLYDLDKTNGKILPEPPKAHEPDTIAAARYVAMAREAWKYLIPVEERTIKDR